MALLHLSRAAYDRCRHILQKTGHPALKLSLRGGGCNGFEYKFDTLKELCEVHTFEHFREKEVDIYICNKSLMFLIGTEIDWTKSVMGESFVFTNPNAHSTCGCGSSFQPNDE